jgi:putative RNA 2'-phosphotransferase
MNDTRTSKFLSLVLRHDPGRVGLTLDESGWVGVPELLDALARHGKQVSRSDLERIVRPDAKGRYDLAGDRIRANQGHSVPVDLGLTGVVPPPLLYHGTAARVVESIRRTGIHRGARHHVHLSSDAETAVVVGSRRGQHVVLVVDAAAMHADGHAFYRSANGVWLTDEVPARYLVDG